MSSDISEKRKIQKRESFKRLINLGLTAICLGMEIALFAYYWRVQFRFSLVEELRKLWFKGSTLEVVIYGVILLLFSNMYGGMRLGYLKNVELIFSQVFSTIIANVFIYGELSVMAKQLFVPDVFLLMTMQQTIVVIVYTNVANRLYRRIFPPRKLLLVHGDKSVDRTLSKFDSRRDKYVITRMIHVNEGFDAVTREILETYESGRLNDRWCF